MHHAHIYQKVGAFKIREAANAVFLLPDEQAARGIRRTGAAFVYPYNDYRVIAGQGTAALELCEDAPDLDVLLAPVGGGGLLSGTALAVSAVSPGTRVFAAEPQQADDAYRSQVGPVAALGES